MAILDKNDKRDASILLALHSSLVSNGNTPAMAADMVNRIFNLDYAVCDYCSQYPSETYEHEGHEWTVCSYCESTLYFPCVSDLAKIEAENA